MQFNFKKLPRAERSNSSKMGKQAIKLEVKKYGDMES